MTRGIAPFWIRCCCTIALRADEQRERVKPRPRQGGVGWVSTDSPQDGVGDACTDHLQGAAGELFALHCSAGMKVTLTAAHARFRTSGLCACAAKTVSSTVSPLVVMK